MISRKAAIDAVENIDCSDGVGISALKCEAVDDGVTAIKALPSAQPEKVDTPTVDTPNCDDTISRQAAIDALDKHLQTTDVPVSYPGIISALTEWLNELPSAQPDSKETSSTHKALDCISRHDAIDAVEKVAELYPWRVPGDRDSYSKYNEAWNDALDRAESEIEALPSAQPDMSEYSDNLWKAAYERGRAEAQAEIIRCKDCKYWREGTVYLYCDKLFGMGVLDAYDYMTDEDDYCSMAERKTDEKENI